MPCYALPLRGLPLRQEVPHELFTGAWKEVKMQSNTSESSLMFTADGVDRRADATFWEGGDSVEGRVWVMGEDGAKKKLVNGTIVALHVNDGIRE